MVAHLRHKQCADVGETLQAWHQVVCQAEKCQRRMQNLPQGVMDVHVKADGAGDVYDLRHWPAHGQK